ncbi:5104_t:CDS:2 [Ambispora leptoticha]|uniref:Protein N-terminal glutamine amidohydrolase n=1 Tax=Ambispora leptoticha TaxID=144679 RepID=A0A9N9D964_9GLOM|nr:5104_t:CDS:2 [Ambispora leptoticha]
MPTSPPQITLSTLTYTACYCEENVYLLCRKLVCDKHPENDKDSLASSDFKIYAVFISNKNETIPLFRQRASLQDNGFIIWDYHVILVYTQPMYDKEKKKSWVYDLDTTLDFPCDFETYAREALIDVNNDDESFERLYRVIPAETFLEVFASDRSHMINSDDGTWMSPPPLYPPILSSKGTRMNLPLFIDMMENKDSKDYGKVFQEGEFIEYFTSKR